MNVCKSYLDALKTELLKKQEEIQTRKQQDNSLKPVKKEKKNIVLKNSGVEERNLKDIAAIEEVDSDVLLKSRRVLEAKSKLYEKLKNTDNAEAKSKYLIDFDLKNEIYSQDDELPSRVEANKEDEHDLAVAEKYNSDENSDPENDWVDFVDTLGRSRRCLRRDLPQMKAKDDKLANTLRPPSPPPAPEPTPEMLSWDMQREALRKKWEEQESLLLGKTDIHYQDLLFDEARPHGVGYFEFSTDEDERLRQQQELMKMRKETMEKQAEARRRKRELLGLPPEEEESVEADQTETEGAVEVKEVNVNDLEAKIKKMAPVRAWDIGKDALPLMTQEEWVEKKRLERPEEFAPPRSLLKNAVTINTDDKSPETPTASGINDNLNNLMPEACQQTSGKLNFFSTKKTLPKPKPKKLDWIRYSRTENPIASSKKTEQDQSLVNNNLKFEDGNPISERDDNNETNKITSEKETCSSMQQDLGDEKETDDDWIGPLPGEAWKQTSENRICSTSKMGQPSSKLDPCNESSPLLIEPIYSGTEPPTSSILYTNEIVSQKNVISESEVCNFSIKPELTNLKDTRFATLNIKEKLPPQQEDGCDDDWIGPMPVGWKKTTESSVSTATNNQSALMSTDITSEVLNSPIYSGTNLLSTSFETNSLRSLQTMVRPECDNFLSVTKLLNHNNTSDNVLVTEHQQGESNTSEGGWIGLKPESRLEAMNTNLASYQDVEKLSKMENKSNQTQHGQTSSTFSYKQNPVHNFSVFHKSCNNFKTIKHLRKISNNPTLANKKLQNNSDSKKTSSPEPSETIKYTLQSIDALLSNIRANVSATETCIDKQSMIKDQITSKTQNTVIPVVNEVMSSKESNNDSMSPGDCKVRMPNYTNLSNKHTTKFKKDHQQYSKVIKTVDPPNLNLNLISASILEDDDSSASTSNNIRTNPSKRKWAEIPPPPCMSYYNNEKRNFKPSTRVDIKDSISVGMDFLNSQRNERSKKKIKGLLDII